MQQAELASAVNTVAAPAIPEETIVPSDITSNSETAAQGIFLLCLLGI